MTELERLEATGHRHTLHDFARVRTKAAETPADLTALDLAILEHFGGPDAHATAYAAQSAAMLAALPSPASPPAVPTTALEVKAVVEGIVPVIKDYVRAAEDRIAQRVTALETRVGQVAAGALRVKGAARGTAARHAVTLDGALDGALDQAAHALDAALTEREVGLRRELEAAGLDAAAAGVVVAHQRARVLAWRGPALERLAAEVRAWFLPAGTFTAIDPSGDAEVRH